MPPPPRGPSRLESSSSAPFPRPSPCLPPAPAPRPPARTAETRPIPPNLAGPTTIAEAVLGRLDLERKGAVSTRAAESVEAEQRTVWGMGGVFPTNSARRKAIARTCEEERERARQGPSFPDSPPGPLNSSTLEQNDPFSLIPPPILRRNTWPPVAADEPALPISLSLTPTVCGDEPLEDNSADQSAKKEDEQGQIGGALMEETGQWGDDFDHHPADPPVRNDWGKIRFVLREPLAEFLGMLVMIMMGVGGDCQVKTSQTSAGSYSNQNWTWGFAVMSAIYIAGGVSGGHMNPAITVSLAIFRGFPWRLVPRYIIAQVLGAFVGALIIYGNYMKALYEYDPLKLIISKDSGNASAPLFITVPNNQVGGTVQGFCQEILATAVLAIVVLALGDENNAPPGAGLGALVLGFVVTAIGMSMGWITGYAINPARDFGPRIALWCLGYGTKLWTHNHAWWIIGPICGPILGGIAGSFVYDVCIFTGPGSPVNSSSSELAHSLRLPKLHNMVRTAFTAPHSSSTAQSQAEVAIEAGYAGWKEDYKASGRRAGRHSKRELEVQTRWRAGREKVRKEEERVRKRRERRVEEMRR